MDLRRVKNESLTEQLKNLARQERKLQSEVIFHIAEVDRRKLFLELAFPSLFEYLVREIGYSASAAQRRIDAARMMTQVPALAAKIESGALKLSQISMVQKNLRALKKISGRKLDSKQKTELLLSLENQNQRNSELIVAKALDLKIETRDLEQIQRDASVRIEMTLTAEEFQILEDVRATLSHALPSATSKETFMFVCRKFLDGKRVVRGRAPKEVVKNSRASEIAPAVLKHKEVQGLSLKETNGKVQAVSLKGTSGDVQVVSLKETNGKVQGLSLKGATGEVQVVSLKETTGEVQGVSFKKTAQEAQRAVSKMSAAEIRRVIFKRDQVCQYKDRRTGQICGSAKFLELDHIQPRWDGGSDAVENLRLLCSAHNVYRYQKGS